MLPQIVGLSCAFCTGRVGSEIDGRFCEGCGNPVHNRCVPPRPVSNDELLSAHEVPKCPRCGGDPRTPVASHVRGLWLGHRAWKEVEDQAPLLTALDESRFQQSIARIALPLSLALLGLALAFVGFVGVGDNPTGALSCVGILASIAGWYLVLLLYSRWYDFRVERKLDRALEENERARIEKGEPLD